MARRLPDALLVFTLAHTWGLQMRHASLLLEDSTGHAPGPLALSHTTPCPRCVTRPQSQECDAASGGSRRDTWALPYSSRWPTALKPRPVTAQDRCIAGNNCVLAVAVAVADSAAAGSWLDWALGPADSQHARLAPWPVRRAAPITTEAYYVLCR